MKILSILTGVILSISIPAQVMAASTPQISVPVKTIIRGDIGSTHVLAEETVNEELVGMVCEVNATAKNQGSVHPGNDIIVSSGDSSVTLVNVEREANGLTNAEGELTMSSDLTVTLVLGKDKVFSGGMDVNLNCEEPEPKLVEVCRDGEVITVKEDEVLSTDTSVPCPSEPEVLTEAVVLPNTGPGTMVAAISAIAGIFGAALHATIVTKNRS
jgi:hypothetical protein